jgi:DNA invertase Pin-like site-specific DNA recombinase
MKVAIYTRVSTDEQTEQNQRVILEVWASDRGWTIVDRYCDIGSAWQVKGDRTELNRLMADCHKGIIDLVLIYDLSRLTRKGPLEMLLTLRRFSENGAQVYSYTETWLNVPSEFNPVLIALYGYMAEIFSKQLSARTKVGMARAKAQGRHIGRPKKMGAKDTSTPFMSDKVKS